MNCGCAWEDYGDGAAAVRRYYHDPDCEEGLVAKIVERGNAEAAKHVLEQQQREAYWRQQNERHTISWFRRYFYDDPVYRIANPDRSAYARTIENPEHPYPEITDWEVIGSGDTHAPSTFVCEGIRYVVRWDYKGGWDRADWDDGWWPDWFVVRRSRWFRRQREIQVYGPPSVAAALGQGV